MQVQIIRQAQREYPTGYGDTKDKFLVQSTRVPADTAELGSELFDSAKNPGLQQSKLRVSLVGPPQPPSPVPEHPETEDGAAASAPASAPFKETSGLVSRGVTGGMTSTSTIDSFKDKAERAERENADLRRKLVARGGATSGGLSVMHLLLVAIVAFLMGYFLKG